MADVFETDTGVNSAVDDMEEQVAALEAAFKSDAGRFAGANRFHTLSKNDAVAGEHGFVNRVTFNALQRVTDFRSRLDRILTR